MESERTGSDLEDGEIREDDFEDISDGSLSDVIPEDCSDDCNLDSLRQEALKSLPVNENETNEEEKYRLEALKSLLENTDFLNENEDSLQDVDDLTEEEKYRLEAIKSLLRNTDFLENLSQSEPPQPQPSNTKKRKRRKRNKNNSIKRIKSETSVETYERTTQAYLEETTSLLSGLSEDVKKINKSLEDKKNNYTDSTNGDKENDTYDSSKLNEIKPPVMDSLTSTPRPWYPKTEFTLLDISSAQNIEIKNNSGDGDYKVLRKQVKCAFSQKNRKLVTTKTTIKRQVSPKSSKPYDSRTVAKSKKLPKVDSASHHLTHIVQTTQVQSVQVETLLNTSAIESPLPSSKDVDANTPIETPAPLPNGLVNNEAINSSFKISTPLREFPTRSFVPSNKIVKSSPKVINANLRYRTVLPTHNNNFSFVPNKDRYKINNTLNTSKYVLKKPTFKVNNSKMKLDKTRKSRYSINHGNNKYKKVNSINPKEFIISLNDEDSSKEDDIKDQTISNKIPRYQNEISSFTIKPPAADETPLHATKSIPQNEVQLSTVKSLPNDDLPITPIKSISNDITLSAIKIAPRDDIPASPKPLVVDEIPFKIKEEPMDIPEESNEDTMSSELPSTTTLEITACVKEETFVGVIDTEPSPISENDEGCETGSIQNEEVTSVKHETNEITPPPSQPELPAEKDETELLYEAEENLIEIRSKLLSSLDELDATVKQNSEEKQKLINMIKQLKLLKAAVTKVEDRIKTQKMKLVMSNSFVRSLCEGVSLRSKTCSKLKDLCAMAGKKIIGPQYKPPDTFETQIAEKEKTVDFSKYILRKPKPTDKK